MRPGCIDKEALSVEQLAHYNDLVCVWGEMTETEVNNEIEYYSSVGSKLSDNDPAKSKFNRELASLKVYKALFR